MLWMTVTPQFAGVQLFYLFASSRAKGYKHIYTLGFQPPFKQRSLVEQPFFAKPKNETHQSTPSAAGLDIFVPEHHQ
jgi:hypothetical protein